MPQDAAAATSGLDKYLKEILTSVNANQPPDPETIAKALTHLGGCRIFLRKFTKPQVGKYYMLTAWVNYFKDDSKNALLAIQRAYGYNKSFDIRASDAAIALLTNNKPSDPPRQQEELKGENILDLDTTSLRNDLLYRKVTPFRANCLNSTTFNYTPGQTGLCLMFWQLKKDPTLDSIVNPDGTFTITDPNGNPVVVKPKRPAHDRNNRRPGSRPNQRPGSRPNRRPGGRPGTPDMMEFGGPEMYDSIAAVDREPTTFETEMSAFKELYLDTYGDGNLKFLAINTDKPAELSKAVNKLADSNWPWAQTMAKLPQSGLEQFADISVDKPIFAIIDKTGTIKYAGSTNGFLPKMILANITDAKLGPGTPQTNTVEQTPPIQTPKHVPPPQQVTPPTTQKAAPQELAPEDDFQAQKLLGAARDLFLAKKIGRLLTPKRGIEMCRRIMKDYPNTKYADEARSLLRENVAPRYRKRYKITDEELGL
jgi:hypothetical protein